MEHKGEINMKKIDALKQFIGSNWINFKMTNEQRKNLEQSENFKKLNINCFFIYGTNIYSL